MANQYYYNGKYYSEPEYVSLGQSLGWTEKQIYGSMQGQDWANQQLASGQSPSQITSSLGSLYTSMTPAQQASYNSFLSSGSTGGCGGGSCGGAVVAVLFQAQLMLVHIPCRISGILTKNKSCPLYETPKV
jgi:hypothetical protein